MEYGVDVRERNVHGMTALTCAAQLGKLETIQVLIPHSLINDVTPTGTTALMLAAFNGHADVVKALIAAGADIHVKRLGDGMNALMLAACNNHDEVFQALVAAGADINAPVRPDGTTQLMLAALCGKTQTVKFLLKQNAPLDTRRNCDYKTALMLAAQKGHLEVVQTLIDAGASIEDEHDLEPALLLAAGNGHNAVVKLLIAHAADVDAGDVAQERTPLMLAIMKGHEQVVTTLLENGADTELTDAYGNCAIMFAAENENTKILEALIKHGTNVNPVDFEGYTPLMMAAMNGHVESVRILIVANANIHAQATPLGEEPEGSTALMYAALNGQLAVVKELIMHGARTDTQRSDGATALMLAAQENQSDVVAFLSHCDNINEKDKTGKTALHHAAEHWSMDALHALIALGATSRIRDHEGKFPVDSVPGNQLPTRANLLASDTALCSVLNTARQDAINCTINQSPFNFVHSRELGTSNIRRRRALRPLSRKRTAEDAAAGDARRLHTDTTGYLSDSEQAGPAEE